MGNFLHSEGVQGGGSVTSNGKWHGTWTGNRRETARGNLASAGCGNGLLFGFLCIYWTSFHVAYESTSFFDVILRASAIHMLCTKSFPAFRYRSDIPGRWARHVCASSFIVRVLWRCGSSSWYKVLEPSPEDSEAVAYLIQSHQSRRSRSHSTIIIQEDVRYMWRRCNNDDAQPRMMPSRRTSLAAQTHHTQVSTTRRKRPVARFVDSRRSFSPLRAAERSPQRGAARAINVRREDRAVPTATRAAPRRHRRAE